MVFRESVHGGVGRGEREGGCEYKRATVGIHLMTELFCFLTVAVDKHKFYI